MEYKSEKRSLPLAVSSKGAVKLPDAQAIEKLFSLATTPEAAEYFREGLKKNVKAMGLTKEFKPVMDEVNHFVDLVQSQSSNRSDYWSGDRKDAAVSKFIHFQQHVSEHAANALAETMTGKAIQFDFAMNDEARLLQGFSSDGKDVDQATSAQINNIYSDWLTKNGMVCESGVVYHMQEDGSPKKDKAGNPQPVKREEYTAKFMDEKEGFSKFVADKTDKKVAVKVTRQDYPQEQASQQNQ